MNLSGNLKPIYDDGKMGFTQAQMYLLTNDSNFVEVINIFVNGADLILN